MGPSRTLFPMLRLARPARHEGGVVHQIAVIAGISALSGVLIAGLALPLLGACRAAGRAERRGREELSPQAEVQAAQRSAPRCSTREATGSPRSTTRTAVTSRSTRSRSTCSSDRRDRGQPLLRARRARRQGHAPRAHHQQANNGVVQGGSSITQQLVKLTRVEPGQANAPRRRRPPTTPSLASSRSCGTPSRFERPLQGPDPRALPQHRLLRRRRIRHPGRRPALLLDARRRAQPRASRRCWPAS